MFPSRPSRRQMLKLAAAMPALALPAPLRAALTAPGAPQPAHHRFRLGEAAVTIVSDGYFQMPTTDLGVNADREEVMAFLKSHRLAAGMSYRHTNHVHVEIGDAKLLVDIGSGHRFVPTTGRLLANLEAAGIDPYEITHVALTHAHPDHIGGLRDEFDEPVLPDAEWFIGANEMAYWLTDDLVNKVAPSQQSFVLTAVNSINAEGMEWTTLADGQEILPGVSVVGAPGHTPGHVAFRIDSGGDSLLVLGDSVTNAYMDFEHPDWVIARDHDKEQTVATRRRLLDMAASDGMAVTGYHFPFPGVGHVMREGEAYRFLPALWRWEESAG